VCVGHTNHSRAFAGDSRIPVTGVLDTHISQSTTCWTPVTSDGHTHHGRRHTCHGLTKSELVIIVALKQRLQSKVNVQLRLNVSHDEPNFTRTELNSVSPGSFQLQSCRFFTVKSARQLKKSLELRIYRSLSRSDSTDKRTLLRGVNLSRSLSLSLSLSLSFARAPSLPPSLSLSLSFALAHTVSRSLALSLSLALSISLALSLSLSPSLSLSLSLLLVSLYPTDLSRSDGA